MPTIKTGMKEGRKEMAKTTGQYGVQVTWLWRSAFQLVSPEGLTILIDPWLKNNPLCPAEYKDLDKVKVDVILFTHGHGDHEGDTVELAKMTGAKVVASVDQREPLVQKGLKPDQIVYLSYGGTVSISGITASMVPAWHTAAPPSSVGFVVGFSSGFKIYHAGDTSIFSDMALVKALYEPQLCLIPVGGLYTMDDRAASLACREYLKPRFAIPMHYPANPRETPSDECAQKFSQQLQGSGTEVIIMKPGETVSF